MRCIKSDITSRCALHDHLPKENAITNLLLITDYEDEWYTTSVQPTYAQQTHDRLFSVNTHNFGGREILNDFKIKYLLLISTGKLMQSAHSI